MVNTKKIVSLMVNPAVMISYVLLMGICFVYADRTVAQFFYHLDMRQQFPWLITLSLLGKWQLPVLILLVLAVYVQCYQPASKWRGKVWFLFLSVFIANCIALVLKIMFGRARPDLWLDSQIYGFYWFKFHRSYWSFPSGHTTTMVSLATALTVIVPRYSWLFFLVAVSVVSTRIFLYHHYLSDVLSTFYLTVIEVGLISCLLHRYLIQK